MYTVGIRHSHPNTYRDIETVKMLVLDDEGLVRKNGRSHVSGTTTLIPETIDISTRGGVKIL